MEHRRKIVAVHALRGRFPMCLRRYGLRCLLRGGHLHRRLRHRRRILPEIAQTPLELFDALAQRPLEPLCVRHARLKTHAPIVRLAQEPFEFRHMTAEPLDDGVGGLLELFFQLLNRDGEFLLVLFAAPSAMNDKADDEQEDGAEDDERAENFSDGNNGRTPPLSLRA